MDLERRAFLKACGAAAGVMMLPCGVTLAAPARTTAGPNTRGMLSDLTKCIGCGWCQQACKEWNDLSEVPASGTSSDGEQACLSAETWTLPELHRVEQNGDLLQVFVKRQCMHCVNPACVSACPVGALQKLDNGAVTYDCKRCIGCRYCMVACPFGIPKFEWDQPLPRIRKCTMCADRQEIGLEPACAAACPTGALMFGDRDELIAEAEARIQADPDRYFPHVYGQEELGGTSWLYLSPVPFEELDFPTLKNEPVTELSEAVATYGTAGVAASVTFLLGGLYYWFRRREGTLQLENMADDQEREVES
jgi:formate dehydrogenase iron-sulfur subunit